MLLLLSQDYSLPDEQILYSTLTNFSPCVRAGINVPRGIVLENRMEIPDVMIYLQKNEIENVYLIKP